MYNKKYCVSRYCIFIFTVECGKIGNTSCISGLLLSNAIHIACGHQSMELM